MEYLDPDDLTEDLKWLVFDISDKMARLSLMDHYRSLKEMDNEGRCDEKSKEIMNAMNLLLKEYYTE